MIKYTNIQYFIAAFIVVLKISVEVISGKTIYSWKTSAPFVFQEEPTKFAFFIVFEILIVIYLIFLGRNKNRKVD